MLHQTTCTRLFTLVVVAQICANATTASAAACSGESSAAALTRPFRVDDACKVALANPGDDHLQTRAAHGHAKSKVYAVAVDYNAPAQQRVSGMVIVLRYPAKQLGLPGAGSDSSVRARVSETPADATVAAYNQDEALRVVIARSTPIPAGRLFRVAFDRRPDSPSVAGSDFTCSVEGCASATGMAEGCSCSVVAP